MTMDAAGMLRACWQAGGGDAAWLAQVRFSSPGAGLPSVWPVSDLAAASLAAAALALNEWCAPQGCTRSLRVDRRLASFWFGQTLRPQGWSLPSPWDSLAGDYRCADGWIRLHTNAPAHRNAALRVLGVPPERAAVAEAVADWSGEVLETALFEAGGCAALMSDLATWQAHPQGRAVQGEPLLARTLLDAAAETAPLRNMARPLAGIRVLDLTRVIAGPVATRFLAGCGASVLRIDPPGWDEPSLVPEVVPGKHCARLDLRTSAGRATFVHLLAGADVLVHGYRPGALEGLGFDAARLRAINPGLVEARLDAWGWSGPWAQRRGFDSLVQMRCGIAHAGMVLLGGDRPRPLPVQALDHAAGYLLAMAVLRGLSTRRTQRCGSCVQTSLARIATLLTDCPPSAAVEPTLRAEDVSDLAAPLEASAWGMARRLAWPVELDGVCFGWDVPARGLGSAAADWPR